MNEAVEAALLAGQEILEVYASDFAIEHKDDRSPLTEADKRAHRAIVQRLESTGLPILSEEGRDIPYEERKNWEYFWMVDPLDGTKEFIKRNGEFTVNIALVHGTTPVGGVIYVPVTDILYVGEVGEGAAKYGEAFAHRDSLAEREESLPVAHERDRFVMVGSRSHMSPETEAYMQELRSERGEIDILSRGSSLKLCMVAEGLADVYPRFAPTMEWDTAAGHAICKAAGFEVLEYPAKTELRYNKQDLLNPWFLVR